MIAITVLGGVAEPVARFVGQKLGAAVEPVMYPNPDAYLQSFGKGEWDIAIGPRVLAPADKADSTANLWAISLVYVAAPRARWSRFAWEAERSRAKRQGQSSIFGGGALDRAHGQPVARSSGAIW